MQENFGVVPCTIMSMASDSLLPAACESDVTGALSMLALVLASGKPSALVDWNNNYGDDPDKAVVFHCSNLPKTIMVDERPRMDSNAILANTFGAENAFGTIVGRVKPGAFTYFRVPRTTRRVECPPMWAKASSPTTRWTPSAATGSSASLTSRSCLAYICENGFEHHVALAQSRVAGILAEAMVKYLGWPVHHHSKESVAVS